MSSGNLAGIVDAAPATTEHQVLLFSGNEATTGTQIIPAGSGTDGAWTYTAARWPGVGYGWYLDVVGVGNGPATASFAVYDCDTAAIVGASSVSLATNGATRRTTSGVFALTDGHRYAVQLGTNNGGYNATCLLARLIFRPTA